MAYSPELPNAHSAALRRIAWAMGKPMTRAIQGMIEFVIKTIDPTNICGVCKDNAKCETCMITSAYANSSLNSELFKQLGHSFTTEVTFMKPTTVSVLISKKIGKNFCSWNVSHGVSAELESEDHYKEAIITLDQELKELVARSLPTNIQVPKIKQLPENLAPIEPEPKAIGCEA